jgi:hypothetical protein
MSGDHGNLQDRLVNLRMTWDQSELSRQRDHIKYDSGNDSSVLKMELDRNLDVGGGSKLRIHSGPSTRESLFLARVRRHHLCITYTTNRRPFISVVCY